MTKVQPSTSLITRVWYKLAPKVLAYLISGVPASAVIYLLGVFGVHIEVTWAVAFVGTLSVIASYVQSDNLLHLPWNLAAPKFIVILLSTVTGTAVVGALTFFGVKLDPGIASVVVVGVSAIAGYFKSELAVIE